MKKFLPALVLVGTSLGGCAALNDLPVQIATATSQTQAIAQALCKFEPTVATVDAVIASLFPGGGAIATVANGAAAAICAAVAGTPVPTNTQVPVSISLSAKKSATAPAFPKVNGVVIQGQFVN